MPAYDIVGDIHGHSTKLEALLVKLGYRRRDGAWKHSDRKAIFVGDLIDRGPGQLPTLELVRAMVDAGSARVTMGNHEFNAIGWYTRDPLRRGRYLRRRSGLKGNRNRHQHAAFLEEIGKDRTAHGAWISWFRQLPLWIEEPGLRVVHACWSPTHVQLLSPFLKDGALLTDKVVEEGSRPGNDIYDAIETLLKGVEVELPLGITFKDKDGHERHAFRTKWWDSKLDTCRTAYMGPGKNDMIPDLPIPKEKMIAEPDRPTFIGHYWFNPKAIPEPAARRVACVDYSAANGGPLVAYQFDGEVELSKNKFVWV